MRWLLAPLVALIACFAVPAAFAAPPANFIYSGDFTPEVQAALARPDVEGVQLIYNWRQLEPQEGQYDFSDIERDLAVVDGMGKKFWIQIQDRFFSTQWRPIPLYIQNEPIYGGGLTPQYDDDFKEQIGWMTMQWNPAVRARFQNLFRALAARFDGRIYGINLDESAATIDRERDQTGFTCDGYFEASLENIRALRAAFTRSHVVQYANFWPCEWNNDHGYMGRIFEDAIARGYGLGGPDIAPYRRGQMRNSYPFFHAERDRLALIAMAVQEPTLRYLSPQTGTPYTRAEFVDFAENYLGADIIFWTMEADWLRGGAEGGAQPMQ